MKKSLKALKFQGFAIDYENKVVEISTSLFLGSSQDCLPGFEGVSTKYPVNVLEETPHLGFIVPLDRAVDDLVFI